MQSDMTGAAVDMNSFHPGTHVVTAVMNQSTVLLVMLANCIM